MGAAKSRPRENGRRGEGGVGKPRPQWGRGVDSRHSRGGWEATGMEVTWCSAVKGNTSSRGPRLERAGGWDSGDRPPSVLPPQPARLNSSGGTAAGHEQGWAPVERGLHRARVACVPHPHRVPAVALALLPRQKKALGGTEAALERNERGHAAAGRAAGVHAAPHWSFQAEQHPLPSAPMGVRQPPADAPPARSMAHATLFALRLG